MDTEAYEKARLHITRCMGAWDDCRSMLKTQGMAAGSPIRKVNAPAAEPVTWTNPEQDALAVIAGSNEETIEFRQVAVELIGACTLVRHATLLAALLEDETSDQILRLSTVESLVSLGQTGTLPALYRVAVSPATLRDTSRGSLYEACITAIGLIAVRAGLMNWDWQRHRPASRAELGRLWWEETQPTEQTILAWSRGERSP